MVLVILVMAASAAHAQATPPAAKVGWIDLQRTLTETKVGKAAKTRLESDKEAKQKQVNDLKDKLKKKAEEFEKQRVLLKGEAIAQRERELQEEYASLQQKFLAHQQELAKQEATLTQDIFQKAKSIIDSIAKRDGYTMIIEKNEGAVLWADEALDITAEVNKRLDAGEGKSETPKADAKGKK
jgi:outer membrane protein